MLSNLPQAKRRREKSLESNLWVIDVTDTDLLNVLYGLDLAEPCYVSEDTKSALLSAVSNMVSKILFMIFCCIFYYSCLSAWF